VVGKAVGVKAGGNTTVEGKEVYSSRIDKDNVTTQKNGRGTN
jgi:hypothetical protein